MKADDFPLRAAFLALPLENGATLAFQELQKRLSEYDTILSFQNPHSPHLTLQYWKELMEIEYHQIVRQAEKVASSTQPFDLKVCGTDTFGTRGEDRVLILSVPFSEPLARLKKRCPWPSALAFSPHITLARIGHPQRFRIAKKKITKILSDAEFVINVDRLRLYAEIEERKQTPLGDFVFV